MNLKTVLEKLFEKRKSPKIVAIVTKTKVRLRARHKVTGVPCPFKEVFAIKERFGIIGLSYGNQIGYQPEKLWNGAGTHTDNPCIVKHALTEKEYLAFAPFRGKRKGREQYEDANGNVICVDGYLDDEREVMMPWRTIAIENILQLKYGKTYSFMEKQ